MFRKQTDTIIFDFWITLIEIYQQPGPVRKDAFSSYLKQKINLTTDQIGSVYERINNTANNLRDRNKEIDGQQFVFWFTKSIGGDDKFRPDLEKIYGESILAMDLKLRDGTQEVLRTLKENYKIGLISNTSIGTVVKALLKRYEIADYFDVLVLSDELGIRKPEPYIFYAALDKLNTYPEKAVFVGDRPDLDVLGAKRCGIYSVYIGDLKGFPSHIPKPDLVIDDLRLLIDRA